LLDEEVNGAREFFDKLVVKLVFRVPGSGYKGAQVIRSSLTSHMTKTSNQLPSASKV
jgi:hypothetical protein